MTSAGSGSGNANDASCIKFSVAIAGLNRLEMQSTNQDIAELANVFYPMFNLNYWGIVGLDSTCPLLQYQDLQYSCFTIFILSLGSPYFYLYVCCSLHYG